MHIISIYQSYAQIHIIVLMDELFDDDIDIFLCNYEPGHDEKPTFKNPSLDPHRSVEFQPSTLIGSNKKDKDSPKVKVEDLKGDRHSLVSLSKKEKNRIAAKQSRDRKKLYIQLMQKQQKKLQNEIEKVNSEIAESKKRISTFISQNKSVSGFTSLNQLQSKLQKLLQSDTPESVEDEINLVLDSILFRMGATGKERIMKINECLKQIINLSLPALHRYLLWSASEKKHFFDDTGTPVDDFFSGMLKTTNCSEEQTKCFNVIQEPVSEQKRKLLNLIVILRQIREHISKHSSFLDEEVMSLRDILTPTQSAALTLNVNRNKFKEEMNFLKLEDNDHSQPSKRVKLEEN